MADRAYRFCGCVVVWCLVALCVLSAASARHWPRPPQWWLDKASCIRQNESGNGKTSRNLYGMLAGWADAGGHGYAGDASRAEQDYRAYRLYQRYGWDPWRCCPGTAGKCGL